ncbi:MAG: DUF1328 domain-containing protein [Candidatus Acidiferrales bacterium]
MQARGTSDQQDREARPGEIKLRWTLAYLIGALIAAILGYWGASMAVAEIAKVLFFVFIILFLVSLVSGLVRRAKTIEML